MAHYDYALEEPGDELPLPDFLDLLARWRAMVLESQAKATQPLPETYRRNPDPSEGGRPEPRSHRRGPR